MEGEEIDVRRQFAKHTHERERELARLILTRGSIE